MEIISFQKGMHKLSPWVGWRRKQILLNFYSKINEERTKTDESLCVEKNDTTDSDFVCHHISFLWDDADCRK